MIRFPRSIGNPHLYRLPSQLLVPRIFQADFDNECDINAWLYSHLLDYYFHGGRYPINQIYCKQLKFRILLAVMAESFQWKLKVPSCGAVSTINCY